MAMATLKMLDTKGPFGGNVLSVVCKSQLIIKNAC